LLIELLNICDLPGTDLNQCKTDFLDNITKYYIDGQINDEKKYCMTSLLNRHLSERYHNESFYQVKVLEKYEKYQHIITLFSMYGYLFLYKTPAEIHNILNEIMHTYNIIQIPNSDTTFVPNTKTQLLEYCNLFLFNGLALHYIMTKCFLDPTMQSNILQGGGNNYRQLFNLYLNKISKIIE